MSIKRLFDFLCSALLMLLLLPLMFIISLIVHFSSSGPIFFFQTRVGENFSNFKIIKFRTMEEGSEKTIDVVPNKKKITKLGRILRKYKLDELPQLVNVLVGDMSIVGPRPETPELFEKYSKTEKNSYCRLKPGITDMASIELIDIDSKLIKAKSPEKFYFSNIIPLKTKLYDDYFIKKSLSMDLKIIYLTVISLFKIK